MKRLLLFLMMLTFAGYFSTKSQTREGLHYGGALEEAIKDFEDTRSEAKEAIEKAVKKLKEEAPDLQETTQIWKEARRNISSQIDELHSKLSTVARRSHEFFIELERIAAIIDDGTLRDVEIARNGKLRASWKEAFRSIKEETRRLTALRDRLGSGIQEQVPRAKLNGHPQERLSYTLNHNFPGGEGRQCALCQRFGRGDEAVL